MVAHRGTSVAGSLIQTLTVVDVATGSREPHSQIARSPCPIMAIAHPSRTANRVHKGLYASLWIIRNSYSREGVLLGNRHVASFTADAT